MRTRNILGRLTVLLVVLLSASTTLADKQDRTLMSFESPEIARAWQAVNDGVMGGRSRGQFKINANKNLEFFGNLSLENNGGFASVRARSGKLKLEKAEAIVLRVLGDGREYNFNLYAQRNLGGYSYRQSFKTMKDQWVEVRLPVDRFVATWRGRRFPEQKLDPARVTGMGILLGDKKPGPFKLEVEWIGAGSKVVSQRLSPSQPAK